MIRRSTQSRRIALSVPSIDGRHFFAPIETLGIVVVATAVASLTEEKRHSLLSEDANVKYENGLKKINDYVTVNEDLVLQLRHQQGEPAEGHRHEYQSEHAKAVLHLVMNSAVRSHALYRVRGRENEAQIDDNREGDGREEHGKPEPADGFLGRIRRPGDERFVRLEGEVREDRSRRYRHCRSPNVGRVVAVLPAVGHPQEYVS